MADVSGTSYNLFLGHQPGLTPRLTDLGIALHADHFVYPLNGKLGAAPYGDIVEVRLVQGYSGLRTIGICVIRFASGNYLAVTSLGARGSGKAPTKPEYRDFIAQFHHRLMASGAAPKINFSRGVTPIRLGGMALTLALIGIGLWLMAQGLETKARPNRTISAFIVTGIGLPFILLNSFKNWPGTYNPAAPPNIW